MRIVKNRLMSYFPQYLFTLQSWYIRSIHHMCSMKKGVLRNFAKFPGKHLWVSYLIKRLWHRCFPVNFAKFVRTPFYRTPLDDCFWYILFILILRKRDFKVSSTKNSFRLFKTIDKDYLINLIKNILPFPIHIMD